MRDRLLVVLASVIVAAACGGGSAPTTTAIPRTTPEIALPEPVPPRVPTAGIAGWENAEVASLCVEVEVEGNLEYDALDTPVDLVTRVASAFGVPVNSEGCDATLTVSLFAQRLSGSYSNISGGGGGGRCYNGSEGRAVATLSMPGRPDVTGIYRHRKEPPQVTSDCRANSPISPGIWARMLIGRVSSHNVWATDAGALADLFGDPIWLAANLAGREDHDPTRPLSLQYSFVSVPEPNSGYNFDQFVEVAAGDLANPDVIALIMARLAGEDRAGRYFAADLARRLTRKGGEDVRSAFEPLVPYLIRALALEDDWELEMLGEMADGTGSRPELRATLGAALRAMTITPESIDDRADLWWEWWQNR